MALSLIRPEILYAWNGPSLLIVNALTTMSVMSASMMSEMMRAAPRCPCFMGRVSPGEPRHS